MLKFISVLLLVSAVSGSAIPDVFLPRGIVSPIDTCGGTGSLLQLRVPNCSTPPCEFVPGALNEIETDFTPREDCELLGVRLFITFNDRIHSINDVEIPGSTVVGGNSYTVKYPLTVTDALETFDVVIHLYCTTSLRNELCVEFPAKI